MKREFKACLMLVVILFVMVGCGITEEVNSINFEAQYIRTDGNVVEISSPIVKKIESVDELNAYYKDNMDNYNFSDSSGESISFTTAIDEYDEAFFEDSFLILILTEESSEDISYEVSEINKDGDILINKILPDEEGTALINWHTIVEISKEYADINYTVSFEKVESRD